ISVRSACRGSPAAKSIRFALRTSSIVATRSASFVRCVLRCLGSRSWSSALMLSAISSMPVMMCFQDPPRVESLNHTWIPHVNNLRSKLIDGKGAKLVLGARRLDRIQALAQELNLGTDAAVETDVTDREQVKRLVDAAVAAHGRIDVIINNAGLMPHSPLERGKVDDWDRMIDVNLKGVLYGIAAALPHMTRQKSGHIINVSSVAGHKVRPGSAVYAATKAAVRMLSEGLRQEVKPYNIRTTVIAPGAVQSDLPTSEPRRFPRWTRGLLTNPAPRAFRCRAERVMQTSGMMMA